MSIELPKLPEGECSEWLQHGKRVNAFPSNRRPMAEQSEYERAYWVPKGYDSAPLFTAGQMRAFGQEAARLALEEAAKEPQHVHRRDPQGKGRYPRSRRFWCGEVMGWRLFCYAVIALFFTAVFAPVIWPL